MFGKKMTIRCRSGLITLKPFEKEEVANKNVVAMFSDHEVTQYLHIATSPTIQDEEEWWEKIRTDKNGFIWGIYLDDSDLLGNTSLRITSPNHSAETGFMIHNKEFWRKGIASACHVARTSYAVNFLNVKTIISAVLSPNLGSFKALTSVGYFITGHRLACDYINGRFRHLTKLQWINPDYTELILEDGIPPEVENKLKPALKLAKKALERAEKEVVF